MTLIENTLSSILLSSGKVTADTLKTVMTEEGIQPYMACQRLVDLGFVSEEDILKILGSYFDLP